MDRLQQPVQNTVPRDSEKESASALACKDSDGRTVKDIHPINSVVYTILTTKSIRIRKKFIIHTKARADHKQNNDAKLPVWALFADGIWRPLYRQIQSEGASLAGLGANAYFSTMGNGNDARNGKP